MLFALVFIAVGLTVAMFATRSSMLGFPSAIFWAVLGGHSYQQSSITWDIYYFLFFASFGMAIFSMFAAYGLKTKKEEAREGDLYFDEGGDDDVKFVDESGNGRGRGETGLGSDLDEDKPSRRVRDIRDRATKRRSGWK